MDGPPHQVLGASREGPAITLCSRPGVLPPTSAPTGAGALSDVHLKHSQEGRRGGQRKPLFKKLRAVHLGQGGGPLASMTVATMPSTHPTSHSLLCHGPGIPPLGPLF